MSESSLQLVLLYRATQPSFGDVFFHSSSLAASFHTACHQCRAWDQGTVPRMQSQKKSLSLSLSVSVCVCVCVCVRVCVCVCACICAVA